MSDNFVLFVLKELNKKNGTYTVTTLRLEQKILDQFEELAARCGCSRNKLMCMALQYALDHLEFVPAEE